MSKEEKNSRELNTESKHEHCVLCFKKLDISKDTEIKDRQYYVKGAGQLCEHCYIRVYYRPSE